MMTGRGRPAPREFLSAVINEKLKPEATHSCNDRHCGCGQQLMVMFLGV
ncbi:hypothetical protein [Streptomyces sp. MCC20]